MIQSKYIKYQSKQIKQAGFTLLELLMVIAVIGILATIAVPRLQNYSNKARFTEVINATTPYKVAVERCLTEHTATDCDAGSNGIPMGFTVAQGRVASVGVVDGEITATGVAAEFPNNGASAPDYKLTPTSGNNGVTWAVKGSCGTDGLCDVTPIAANATNAANAGNNNGNNQ